MEIAILAVLLIVVWYYGHSLSESIAQLPNRDPQIEKGVDNLAEIERHVRSIEQQLHDFERIHRLDGADFGKKLESIAALSYELQSIERVLAAIQLDIEIITDHPAFTHERS